MVGIQSQENKMEEQKPKAGIGVMILKDGKVLLGKRKGSHGAGEYAFTGGGLEYMESFENCAKRETREEAGIEIKNVRFNCVSNVTAYPPSHYVHIGLVADWESGEPKVLERDKRESWGWYDLDNLPFPLFAFCKMEIEAYKGGNKYFDGK